VGNTLTQLSFFSWLIKKNTWLKDPGIITRLRKPAYTHTYTHLYTYDKQNTHVYLWAYVHTIYPPKVKRQNYGFYLGHMQGNDSRMVVWHPFVPLLSAGPSTLTIFKL